MNYGRCVICGEQVTDDPAEMQDPTNPEEHSGLVHADCGLANGWVVS
jgi:hypothetical protein